MSASIRDDRAAVLRAARSLGALDTLLAWVREGGEFRVYDAGPEAVLRHCVDLWHRETQRDWTLFSSVDPEEALLRAAEMVATNPTLDPELEDQRDQET
jgi:hypothetical protein